MKKITRTRLLIAALAVMLLSGTVLSGCSSKSGNDASVSAPEYTDKGNGMVDYDSPASPEMSDKVEADSGNASADFERKFVRTISLSCETKAFDPSLTTVMTALTAHGGYVETSSVVGTGYVGEGSGSTRRAVYTLRLPAEKLDPFLEALRKDEGIRVLSQSAVSDEITGAYYDTQSRLDTLATERDALSAMLAGFTDYSDIDAMLRVQERLYNVIEEMEALQTRLNLYDDKAAMATVNLTLHEVATYTKAAEPSFGARIKDAFSQSWRHFGEGCQDAAVWFVESLPGLLVFAVIVGGVLWIVLACVRRRKRKRADRQGDTSDDTSADGKK